MDDKDVPKLDRDSLAAFIQRKLDEDTSDSGPEWEQKKTEQKLRFLKAYDDKVCKFYHAETWQLPKSNSREDMAATKGRTAFNGGRFQDEIDPRKGTSLHWKELIARYGVPLELIDNFEKRSLSSKQMYDSELHLLLETLEEKFTGSKSNDLNLPFLPFSELKSVVLLEKRREVDRGGGGFIDKLAKEKTKSRKKKKKKIREVQPTKKKKEKPLSREERKKQLFSKVTKEKVFNGNKKVGEQLEVVQRSSSHYYEEKLMWSLLEYAWLRFPFALQPIFLPMIGEGLHGLAPLMSLLRYSNNERTSRKRVKALMRGLMRNKVLIQTPVERKAALDYFGRWESASKTVETEASDYGNGVIRGLIELILLETDHDQARCLAILEFLYHLWSRETGTACIRITDWKVSVVKKSSLKKNPIEEDDSHLRDYDQEIRKVGVEYTPLFGQFEEKVTQMLKDLMFHHTISLFYLKNGRLKGCVINLSNTLMIRVMMHCFLNDLSVEKTFQEVAKKEKFTLRKERKWLFLEQVGNLCSVVDNMRSRVAERAKFFDFQDEVGEKINVCAYTWKKSGINDLEKIQFLIAKRLEYDWRKQLFMQRGYSLEHQESMGSAMNYENEEIELMTGSTNFETTKQILLSNIRDKSRIGNKNIIDDVSGHILKKRRRLMNTAGALEKSFIIYHAKKEEVVRLYRLCPKRFIHRVLSNSVVHKEIRGCFRFVRAQRKKVIQSGLCNYLERHRDVLEENWGIDDEDELYDHIRECFAGDTCAFLNCPKGLSCDGEEYSKIIRFHGGEWSGVLGERYDETNAVIGRHWEFASGECDLWTVFCVSMAGDVMKSVLYHLAPSQFPRGRTMKKSLQPVQCEMVKLARGQIQDKVVRLLCKNAEFRKGCGMNKVLKKKKLEYPKGCWYRYARKSIRDFVRDKLEKLLRLGYSVVGSTEDPEEEQEGENENDMEEETDNVVMDVGEPELTGEGKEEERKRRENVIPGMTLSKEKQFIEFMEMTERKYNLEFQGVMRKAKSTVNPFRSIYLNDKVNFAYEHLENHEIRMLSAIHPIGVYNFMVSFFSTEKNLLKRLHKITDGAFPYHPKKKSKQKQKCEIG